VGVNKKGFEARGLDHPVVSYAGLKYSDKCYNRPVTNASRVALRLVRVRHKKNRTAIVHRAIITRPNCDPKKVALRFPIRAGEEPVRICFVPAINAQYTVA